MDLEELRGPPEFVNADASAERLERQAVRRRHDGLGAVHVACHPREVHQTRARVVALVVDDVGLGARQGAEVAEDREGPFSHVKRDRHRHRGCLEGVAAVKAEEVVRLEPLRLAQRACPVRVEDGRRRLARHRGRAVHVRVRDVTP